MVRLFAPVLLTVIALVMLVVLLAWRTPSDRTPAICRAKALPAPVCQEMQARIAEGDFDDAQLITVVDAGPNRTAYWLRVWRNGARFTARVLYDWDAGAVVYWREYL